MVGANVARCGLLQLFYLLPGQPGNPGNLAFFALLPQRIGGVKNAALPEKPLADVLHLNDELFAPFIFAVEVKHGPAVPLRLPQVFGVQVRQIPHLLPVPEYLVEKINEQTDVPIVLTGVVA